MANDQPAGIDSLGEGWLTIAKAAEVLEVSAKTVRRRLKAGEITGKLVHDPKIGAERWMIPVEALPTATGVALIPVELLDRLEDAWRQARESNAEAAVAEQRADFETDRRQRTEAQLEATEAQLEATEGDRERRGRHEAQLKATEGDRDRALRTGYLLALEVAGLRTRLESALTHRWWHRRSRGETVSHAPPNPTHDDPDVHEPESFPPGSPDAHDLADEFDRLFANERKDSPETPPS